MSQITTSNSPLQRIVFIGALIISCTPYISPPIALLIGFLIAQTTGHPYLQWNSKATKQLLKIAIIGLGFGMNIHAAIEAGQQGFFFTIATLASTFALGFLFAKLLKVEKVITLLISSGTAICGGSAIAAVSPITKASDKQISVALGTVFILNALALLIFPLIGNALALTQEQFGLWAAIAIHDTSSVVGAAAQYGDQALQIATTIKLERALWIIPLSLITAFFFKQNGDTDKKKTSISIPYFIVLFIVAMLIRATFPEFTYLYDPIVFLAKRGFTITLFLIGAGLSMSSMKAVGFRPFLLGVLLWILLSVGSLSVVMFA